LSLALGGSSETTLCDVTDLVRHPFGEATRVRLPLQVDRSTPKAPSRTFGAGSFAPRACRPRIRRCTIFGTPGPCGRCGRALHQKRVVCSQGGRRPRWCMRGTADTHSAMSLPAPGSNWIAGAQVRSQLQLEAGTKIGPIGA
jgi:hypothetical protein